MDKLVLPKVKLSNNKPLLLAAGLCLMLTMLFSPPVRSQNQSQAEKQKIVRQVADKWIQVGIDYYNRGFYKAAEQSFDHANDYKDYLSTEQQEQVNSYLEKTHIANLERNRVLNHIKTANESIDKGQYNVARAHLTKAQASEYLTADEKRMIGDKLASIANQADKQDAAGGQPVKEATEEETKVVESDKPATTPAKEEEAAPAKKEAPAAAEQATPAKEEKPDPAPAVPAVIETVKPKAPEYQPVTEAQQESYISSINRKRNIICSHTKAVVNDAISKSQLYVNQNQFDKAKEAIEYAKLEVDRNQTQLDDGLYGDCCKQLQQMNDNLVAQQATKAKEVDEQRLAEAAQAQDGYRTQMEIERGKRIADLMDSAITLQKQQRYEEALGQLDSLLVLDPQNDKALILKQTLEDTIAFRKQLEIARETEKERLDILTKSDESMIPYANELEYPKNWREIAAKRKPEDVIGEDPATAELYKQIEKTVDLSSLSPTMTFGEAIEVLKNSVTPPLRIVVLWKDLQDNAEIDQTTPINMDPISGIPLSKALQLMLKSVSGGFTELGYVVSDGVITIATVSSLPGKLETMVYDITDLLGRPADFFVTSQSGGGGGGGGSITDVGGQGFQGEDQQQMDAQTMRTEGDQRADGLVSLLQGSIDPDSWYDAGGEGTVTVYQRKKLIVRQSPEVHNKIKKLLVELRKSLGHQVAIEARFLLVGENFLESIGVDVSPITINLGEKWSPLNIRQASAAGASPANTGIAGSFGGVSNQGDPLTLGAAVSGGYGGIMDDLQVTFLIQATQANRDTKQVTAPKVTVLSGESATMRLQDNIWWAGNIEPQMRESGGTTGSSGGSTLSAVTWTINYEERRITSGTILNVTPTITPDRKHVLLNITAQLDTFLGFRVQTVRVPVFENGSNSSANLPLELPQIEVSRVQTRVSVPDCGTLLLGGQKMSTDVETEIGVPILSKIPVVGRLFGNKSKVKDTKVLLILVKPTIILQEETEAETLAAMQQ